jgi:hypothetical protein
MLGLGLSVIGVLMITAIAYAGVTGHKSGAITRVGVVDSTSDTTITGTTGAATGWIALPGASVTLNNSPAGRGALFLVRFSGESVCSDAPAGSSHAGFCNLRIMVNGKEAEPADGGQFAFDTNSEGAATDGAESHAIDRSLVVAATSSTVAVQVQYQAWPNTSFRLDDWQLTVERSDA